MSGSLDTARAAHGELVVIGASAGGVDALGFILPELPAGLPVPIAIVTHLPPDRPSLLAEIFQAKCQVVIKEAEEGEPLEAGVVYFAAPDYHLLIESDHSVSLSVDDPVLFSRPSIDVLFESAAIAYGDRAVGILLSGANDDGARGLEAIQRGGGMTVVQDPQQAQVRYMPEQALAQGKIDEVLTLSQIADLLRSLAGAQAEQDKERR